MSRLTDEPSIANLMALGVAMPVTGRLIQGALIDASNVVGASVQSTDNLLNSVSLDDEFLSRVGRGMLIVAWGTLAANGNTKDIKLKLGTTAIVTITDTTANAKDFLFVALVVSDGVDSQRGTGFVLIDGALVAASSVNLAAATVDGNVTQTITTTGDNNSAAASAATGKGLVVLPFSGAA